jgi:transposase
MTREEGYDRTIGYSSPKGSGLYDYFLYLPRHRQARWRVTAGARAIRGEKPDWGSRRGERAYML